MEQITKAVETARFNESIIVSVENEGENQVLHLVPTIDENNGGIEWKNLGPDPQTAIIRHCRTKNWVLPMLNDKPRNAMYEKAIQMACKEAASRFFNDEKLSSFRILDIGSGSGLLAMMACKYSTKALNMCKKESCFMPEVLSLEMASAMAELARRTVAANNMSEQISIQEKHSCETTLQEKAMLCTSELLESGLLGEGIIPSLRDAWKRHLHPNAVIVPQRARVCAVLIEDHKDWICKYLGPSREIELRCSGVTTTVRLSSSRHSLLIGDNIPGVSLPIHAQFEDFGNMDSNSENSQYRALSSPLQVLDFDFTSFEKIPSSDGRSRSVEIYPTVSGTVHAILFWWELDLIEGVTYSTKSGEQEWQDHWHQCLYIFQDSTFVECGKSVKLTCHHTDTCLSFSICKEPLTKRPKIIRGYEKPRLTPLRAAMLADHERLCVFQKAISSVLKDVGLNSLFLDLSDFSLCGILASLHGARHVMSLESTSGELPMIAARVAQIGNKLPKDGANFQILQCYAENLSLEVLGGKPAKVAMTEPYYEKLEKWHLQEAFNYYYLLRGLRSRGALDNNFISIPSRSHIMACFFESETIYNAYNDCGDRKNEICGFDHSTVNMYASRYHEHDLSIPLWQYSNKYIELTNVFELAILDYDSVKIDDNLWRKASLLKPGTVHGVFLWVTYHFPFDKEEDDGDITTAILHTKDRPYNQLVRLMEKPVKIDDINNHVCFCKITIGNIGDHETHRLEIKVEKTSTV